jgi:hypothetical protein
VFCTIFAAKRVNSCQPMVCDESVLWVILLRDHFKKYLMVGIMFKILLIISVVVAIICMGVVITCLLAAARENGLPDIDDVDLVELFSSKIQP